MIREKGIKLKESETVNFYIYRDGCGIWRDGLVIELVGKREMSE